MTGPGFLVREDPNTPGGLLVHLDATTMALTQSTLKANTYTAQSREIVLADTSAGTFTVTGPPSGAVFGLRWKTGTVAPTVAAPSGFTINGGSTITPGLPPNGTSGELLIWQAFGTDYQPLSSYKPQGALDGVYRKFAPRIGTTASSATPTPNMDAQDQFNVTALAVAATFGAPTGTPGDGQPLVIRIKDNGTAQTLAWNAAYRALGVTLPTTTVLGKTLYLGGRWNAADSKLDVLAIGQQG